MNGFCKISVASGLRPVAVMALLASIGATIVLSACGQKGPLTLPPAATTAAAASAASAPTR